MKTAPINLIVRIINETFGIKFNHGVEIGAHLAYVGHYKRTGDKYIRKIASEEVDHLVELEKILKELGEKPITAIDESFRFVGNIIGFLCAYCPIWSLNLVARSMELFAIYNYKKLAIVYPQYKMKFIEMALAEKRHETFFRTGVRPALEFFDKAHIYMGPEDGKCE